MSGSQSGTHATSSAGGNVQSVSGTSSTSSARSPKSDGASSWASASANSDTSSSTARQDTQTSASGSARSAAVAAGVAGAAAAGIAAASNARQADSRSAITGTAATGNVHSGTGKGNLSYANPTGEQDDLKLIKGIGPVIEKDLNGMGIQSFRQIAEFNAEDIAAVDTALDFPGRIERDEWIPQAKSLLSGKGAAGTRTQPGAGRSGSGGGTVSASATGSSATGSSATGSSATGSSATGSSTTGSGSGVATGSVAAAGIAAAAAAVAGAGASGHTRGETGQHRASSDQGDHEQFNLSAADLSSEIAERIKILNMRSGDSPRLNVSRAEFDSLAAGGTANLSTSKLSSVLSILRWLCA